METRLDRSGFVRRCIILGMVLLLASCAAAGNKVRDARLTFPGEPDARLIYQHVTQRDIYSRWKHWAGRAPVLYGTEASPHMRSYVTFVNDVCAQSMRAGTELAEGSIIVREKYSAENRLEGLTVACKVRRGANGAHWIWVSYDPDGTVTASSDY